MKNLFFAYFILAPVFSASAQGTWIQKLSYNFQSQGYIDTLTGANMVEVGPDGSLYVLANIDNDGTRNIFKFSPNSHNHEWDINEGWNGSQVCRWTNRFRATSDTGIIVCINVFDELWGGTWSILKKYSKDGLLQWERQFGFWLDPNDHTAHDVLEKKSGGYLALIEDSIFTLDNAGNVTDSSGVIAGRKFLEMSNGDLLVLTSSNQLIRTDSTGNIIWSQNCSGAFAYDTTSVFILNSGSFVQKVDAVTGVQLWNKNYGFSPVSDIEATHAGGFIASVGYKPTVPYSWGGIAMPGVLFRADSLGDTLWTRTYNLPHFGLSTIKIMPNGNLCSGGCYLSGWANGWYPNNYSAFCCMMNFDGSYPLQQTSYFGPQDANHDHIANFVDDALEVMLGLGQTGTARDTTIYGYPFPCERNDIAIDWPTFTNSGANRKYSDYDGNGSIDTSDIQLCDWSGYIDSFPSLYRNQNPGLSQSAEEFCLVPVSDTIAPGDTAYYYMVLGNAANPVDSIYGFAFTYMMDPIGNDFADSIFLFNSDFGTEGIDLFKNHRHITNLYQTQDYRSRTLICRTNFQNAFGINDTIGIIRYRLMPFPHPTTPGIRRFKAILADGTEIPFNTCMGDIYIDSSLVSMQEKQTTESIIFPNPAADFIFVKNAIPGKKRVIVVNSMGQHVKEFLSSETECSISVRDLPNGIFTLHIQSDLSVSNSTFIVQH